MAVGEKKKVRFGPFEVDLHSGELSRDGIRLKLQPQPIQVLAILLEHPGELVTRDELRKRLWPEHTFVDFEQGLNTAIKKLRVALCDEAEKPHYIETLPRRGYRFIGEVAKTDGATASPEPDNPKVRADHDEPQNSQSPRDRPLVRKTIFLALFAVAVTAIFLKLAYDNFFPPPPRIVATRQLTHTQVQKRRGTGYYCYLVTDGSRVYFQEHRPRDRWFFSQVSTAGGEVSDVPSPAISLPCLYAISPSGNELLASECCPWKYWFLPLPAGSARVAPLPSDAFCPAWTPDGRSFVYASIEDHKYAMFRTGVDAKNPTRMFAMEDITWPRVSPDGSLIRWTVVPNINRAKDLWEAGIDGKNPHPIFPEMKGETFFGDWTNDGKLFFFLRRIGPLTTLWVQREKRLWPVPRPKPTLLYAGPMELWSPVSSKDSKELYVIGAVLRGELSIYDSKLAKFSPYLNGLSACFVTFSPDHQWIAYVSYPDGALWKSRLDGSEKMQLTFPPMGVINPRWSPDSKFIVFSEWFASDHHSIYVVPAEGGEPRLLLSGPSEPADPTWSPDSKRIVYGGAEGKPVPVSILNLETMQSTDVPGSQGFVESTVVTRTANTSWRTRTSRRPK